MFDKSGGEVEAGGAEPRLRRKLWFLIALEGALGALLWLSWGALGALGGGLGGSEELA